MPSAAKLKTQSPVSPIEEIIEEARNGRMFVLVDAEDRENEGDLVIPAQMATPDAINFMAKHGRGLICLALTQARADALKLELMARSNQTRHSTAFTVSIEAREGVTTGISAHDRARTIAVATDPTKDARDIVSPGHVFPLVARDGGVLVRAGHTEAAVDIARLAGLTPAGVICEIMNDDGSMARLPELAPFARRHGLKIGAIADLIAYRRKYDRLVRLVGETGIESPFGGAFQMKVYENSMDHCQHIALVKGEVSGGEPPLVRMHAVNILEDVLGAGCEDGRRSLVERAMRVIAAEGRGVLVLIRDVKAGAVTAALQGEDGGGPDSARRLVDYGVGAQILLDLGVKRMVLLSNSPVPRVVGLEGFGLEIVGRRPIE
ncbi:MAG: 3,4-dihydroxy-2-butanone-4-phosphate synthase [Hyphomicrobiales bacterium]|nr:3,4-dihydroxy-2-butanone-4-phosphate synthase [Hyphomicrobiales bacterium]